MKYRILNDRCYRRCKQFVFAFELVHADSVDLQQARDFLFLVVLRNQSIQSTARGEGIRLSSQLVPCGGYCLVAAYLLIGFFAFVALLLLFDVFKHASLYIV